MSKENMDKDERENNGQKKHMDDVVGAVTVKALREFSTGEMTPEAGTTSHPCRPLSVPRPDSATKVSKSRGSLTDIPSSRVGSRTGSRHASASHMHGSQSGHDVPVSRDAGHDHHDDRPSSSHLMHGSKSGHDQPAYHGSSDEHHAIASASASHSDTDHPAQAASSHHMPCSQPCSMDALARKRQAEEELVDGDYASKYFEADKRDVYNPMPTDAVSKCPQYADRPNPFPVEDPQEEFDTDEPCPDSDLDFENRPPGGLVAPGGGDDDDDDGGSDFDDYNEGEDGGEQDVDEACDDDAATELVVLDPDHPLMQRFQRALHAHLEKQREKVQLEHRELTEAVRTRRREREEVGIELYGVQQELARYQTALEKLHDDLAATHQARQLTEKELNEVREMYKERQKVVEQERKKGADLQAEVENIALRLFYMENAKHDVRSDIAVMKRAAEKAEADVAKAEVAKQQQDLYVDRLVERMDKLREQIAMYDAQLAAQTEETRVAKESLMEARMEIESILLEKKQLFQQWNSSLIGMKRRDEAHTAMLDALNQQQQRLLSLDTELDGLKKSIQKEQETNEKLTNVLNRTEADIITVRKMLTSCQAKYDALKAEYAILMRILTETEHNLNRANAERTSCLNQLNHLRKDTEKEFLEKMRLEDAIMEKMREQLTMDKASQYTEKLTKKMRDRTKELEGQIALAENDISKTILETSHTKSRIESLQKVLSELEAEIDSKNKVVSQSESDSAKRNSIIERKQCQLDTYNKKLEQLIAQAGGEELGPLEIEINSLQRSIDGERQSITDMQQMWLREQTELVRLSKERDEQSLSVELLKKQLTILTQKKIRLESDIDSQKAETQEIERNIRTMQNDMMKLNSLLHEQKGSEEFLQQDTMLLENVFVGNLKQAEKESIELQEKLQGMKEEKERLLNSLVEAERQIMLWEKKIQLAKETRAAVDSDAGQGEIAAMKAEIHRMQVRYTQLMKQQEKMIQEMEKSVSRRDTIVTRSDAQAKSGNKVLTKGTFQRQMVDMRKKIKQAIQDANECDNEFRELRSQQQEMSLLITERQTSVKQLQSNADMLDEDVERLLQQKHKNMCDLVARQQKGKYYQQVKENRYVRLCKTDSALDAEYQRQVDRMQAVTAIVDRLSHEYPSAHTALQRVKLCYGTRCG